MTGEFGTEPRVFQEAQTQLRSPRYLFLIVTVSLHTCEKHKCGGLGSVRFTAGLNNLKGLFQPE